MQCLCGDGLFYINKNLKRELVEFEGIKELTERSIIDNVANLNLVRDWRRAIRRTILDVRDSYVKKIDQFTNKIIKSLSKIDYKSEELRNFRKPDPDSMIARQINKLDESLNHIDEVFEAISIK